MNRILEKRDSSGIFPVPARLIFFTNMDLKRLVFLLPVLVLFPGCVATPEGTKFDPVEGSRRINNNLDTTINRLQDRSYDDVN